jgi:hypothetical protein
MNLAKELEKLREQVASLKQKSRVGLFLPTESHWDHEQIQAAADALVENAIRTGRLDPQTQEPLIARFWTQAENDATADKVWRPEQWEM